MRLFTPLLAVAIGAATLYATPALAETTTAQHKQVALQNDDDWHPWYALFWALRQWEAWDRDDDMGQVPDTVPDTVPEQFPAATAGA